MLVSLVICEVMESRMNVSYLIGCEQICIIQRLCTTFKFAGNFDDNEISK